MGTVLETIDELGEAFGSVSISASSDSVIKTVTYETADVAASKASCVLPPVAVRDDTKATKSDDAEVDVANWNRHLCSGMFSHLDPCAPRLCRAVIALQSFGL